MKLTLIHQFQDFLKSIGIDLGLVLENAGLSKYLWQEELDLAPMDYYKFLQDLDSQIPE
ncbi:hypothetical protein [Streptococcus sp. 20-1249]|uniref:hypothetical protein n=1 Tax=Streptococcus hepaticus TaxID=3349163 RepID=UPI002987FFE0